MTRHISPGRVIVKEDTAGTSDPVIVNGLAPVTVVVIPVEGGSGKAQYTTSPMETAAEQSAAVWRDWAAGAVSETTESVIDGAVTAVRCVKVSGASCGFEVVAA